MVSNAEDATFMADIDTAPKNPLVEVDGCIIPMGISHSTNSFVLGFCCRFGVFIITATQIRDASPATNDRPPKLENSVHLTDVTPGPEIKTLQHFKGHFFGPEPGGPGPGRTESASFEGILLSAMK
jgi:hypothetical protein